MTAILENYSFAAAALIAGIFTWSITALGAAVVFLFKKINNTALNSMLGFSGGVMTAASFWSLLEPAISDADALGQCAPLVTVCGFLCGGILLFSGDLLFSRLSPRSDALDAEASGSRLRRTVMLVFSITLHNVPEGLAIGVAFGCASVGLGLSGSLFDPAFAGAWMLAVGIVLHNFPEGTAVIVPLRREGMSRSKAFLIGQASAIVVTDIGADRGAGIASVQFADAFLLSFAAGAMTTLCGRADPESQNGNDSVLNRLSPRCQR